jgi:hypothetical protein
MHAARVAPKETAFRPVLPRAPNAGLLPEKSMATYWEKLKDPRWQRKRLEIMERADFSCEECGDKTTTLNVHHKLYRKGAAPWEYSNDELRCLCEGCHGEHHELRERLDRALANGCCHLASVVGYAEGTILLCNPDRPDEYHLTLDSYEHAEGIAAAFAITVDDVFHVADENSVVDGRVLWDAHHKRYDRKRLD